jgi:glyoxylate carboligase
VNGAEFFLDTLARAGVDTLFGLPGSTEASLLEALRERTDLTYVLGLHEGPVVSMADGLAGSPGYGRPGTRPAAPSTAAPSTAAPRTAAPRTEPATRARCR